MGKIGIIIQREFYSRVRKRTFIVTTILTPLLLVAVMFAPALLMQMRTGGPKQVMVVDKSGIVWQHLESDKTITFEQATMDFDRIKEKRAAGELEELFGVLVIGADIADNPRAAQLYTYQSSTIDIESTLTGQIESAVEAEKLKEYNIENLPQILDEIKTDVTLQSFRIDETGAEKESSSALSMILSFVFAFMIYMFVLIYGGMVLQGVIEEKSSKVIEVIVSSVKPFELMMGKIIGIAAVAITQFLIWVVLIFVLGTLLVNFLAGGAMAEAATAMAEGNMAGMAGMEGFDAQTVAALRNITDPAFLLRMLGGFLLFFIGGYLFYAAMFAAVGSAVDNEADSQQLQVPITIPLILAILVMMTVIKEPHSSLAVWFSMIPFTSPIIMMARLPYGVPAWEIILSLVILYASFVVLVWLAGKIYRVGIFMTGKKPTFSELAKWIRYKS